jgi:orotidine-5'-phosphate decarboxylase
VNFADRVAEAQRRKESIAVLGVDPQLDAPDAPGVPPGYTLERFCCETVEACASSVVAIKVQLAFFEARGVEGMRALAEVIRVGRRLGLITIADAKRGDIGSTSAAYAEAFLGDGDFGCDAVTVNPYLGSDALMPFVARARDGRGVFVLVKNSNPSAGEFQDLSVGGQMVWEIVAARVRGIGQDFKGACGLSSIGAVVGASYPTQARRARELMPDVLILVPGYGAQGASAQDAVAAARPDGIGIIVSSSRALMYAYKKHPERSPAVAAAEASEAMRLDLGRALKTKAAAESAR